MSRAPFSQFWADRLEKEVRRRRVVVWYDPGHEWWEWVSAEGVSSAERAELTEIRLGGSPVSFVSYRGSYLELLDLCEPLAGGSEPQNLIVYLGGEEPVEELSPIRELECIGGDAEPFVRPLSEMAVQALRAAGESDQRIDELISDRNLTLSFLDGLMREDGGEASPLKAVFGTSKEREVIARFLVDGEVRDAVHKQGLTQTFLDTVSKATGLSPSQDEPTALAAELARLLLANELRLDLTSGEIVEIAQLPAPASDAERGNIRETCVLLRRRYPKEYEAIAMRVEEELGLQQAAVDPAALGGIDTFSFEERALLAFCGELLAKDRPEHALSVCEERSASFWTAVDRFPDRAFEWSMCRQLSELAMKLAETEKEMGAMGGGSANWIERYVMEDGWHQVDRLQRAISYHGTNPASDNLDDAKRHVLQRHDAVLQQMSEGFISALQEDGWDPPGQRLQTQIFSRSVEDETGRVAYVLADALRYEMGAELKTLLVAVGASEVHLEHAVAALPSITPVGMAALMPGAERSFTVEASDQGVVGVVDGEPLMTSAKRMDFLKARIPGAIDLTVDDVLVHLSKDQLRNRIQGTRFVVMRSQEIDGAGEQLPANLARKVMATVLEDLRHALVRLADAGVERFVVVADHGHLFGRRRGDDMKIPLPENGHRVDAHRRCWVGSGGTTPPGARRLALAQLGYPTDLEAVVPVGLGVFKTPGGDLAYHHGGASLQELIVPVLSFSLTIGGGDSGIGLPALALENLPQKVPNRIFSLTVRTLELPLEPLRLQVLAVDADGSTVGKAVTATSGWSEADQIVTMADTKPLAVALQLDDEDVTELRIRVVVVSTGRVLKESIPIPVRLLK